MIQVEARRYSINKLLWIDSFGGLLVGALVLFGHRLIANWHNLQPSLIVFLAIANLIYGSYSLALALRSKRPLAMIKLLAVANMCWCPACIVILAINWSDISPIGILHLAGEAMYVGGLGFLEWRFRSQLVAS